MGQIRKNHSADFKAQVALAAIREDATIAELSSKFGIHASLIQRWKKEALAGMKDIFSSKQVTQETSHLTNIKDLHAKIGQLTVERDFLENASRRLGLFAGKK